MSDGGVELPQVLVLDDEPAILQVLSFVVEQAGGAPHTAATLADARRLLGERSFALALLDKNLPDGSGLEVLRGLRADHPDTDAMIVTAYANTESAIEALRLGAIDYLVKPIDVTATINRVRIILERRRLLAENAQMQALLLRTDRLTSLGTLAAGIAHEINNPLAYVMANLDYAHELLRESREASPKGGADQTELGAVLEDVRHGANRVRRIVQDLKLFARGDDDPPELVDLRQLLDSSVNIAWNDIRLRARLVRDYQAAPKVLASASRLGQVCLNLLVNAAHALPIGSADQHQIRVATGADPEGNPFFEIEDDGCGIAPDHLKRIFDPFFTTKPVGVGTGLGLAICHGVVTALGGRIDVESQEGKGTRFRVQLKQHVGDTPAPRLDARPVPRLGRGARVLIVDDEPLLTTALERLLVPEHQVTSVESASRALDLISSGHRFDAIVSDLLMPQVTGMELYDRVREIAPDQAERVIFLTGAAVVPTMREFFDRAHRPVLHKPVDVASLTSMIQMVCDAPAGHQVSRPPRSGPTP